MGRRCDKSHDKEIWGNYVPLLCYSFLVGEGECEEGEKCRRRGGHKRELLGEEENRGGTGEGRLGGVLGGERERRRGFGERLGGLLGEGGGGVGGRGEW